MLKIESKSLPTPTNPLPTDAPQKIKVPWGNLDDVPEFALSTLLQLYNVLIKPFERAYGIIIHGPIDLETSARAGHWGRRVQLPTGELLQLKFSPRNMLEEAHDGIAMIAVKVSNAFGGVHVRTAILFPPEVDVPPHLDLLRRSRSVLGPRGLHMLLISFFKSHYPLDPRSNQVTSASWTTDPFGYASVRSTTFSITNTIPNKSRKTKNSASKAEYPNFDHRTANSVAPGTSGMLTAAEISNCDMPDSARRAAEPINEKQWSKIIETAAEGVCRDDAEVGRGAIAASIAITELLSGEGIIGMLSNEFFKGALPDQLHNPLGNGLLICMAARIAMLPGIHGLKSGSMMDEIANAEVRSLFEAQMQPLPFMNKMWALDVVINTAKINTKSIRNFGWCDDPKTLVNDQLVYWQRVGQSIITSIYGTGTSLDKPPSNRFGVPYKFTSALLSARDARAVELGVHQHNIREPARISLSSTATVRQQFVRLMLETEKYLRTGYFVDTQLAPKNDDASATSNMLANHLMIQNLLMPHIQQQLKQGEAFDAAAQLKMKDEIYTSYCMSAISQASGEMTEALTAGPAVHFQHKIGAYLVSESQKYPCCDCGGAVHVLQGVLLNFAYGECTSCHSKRCLECSSKYGIQMLTSGSKKWGVKCLQCGAEPPRAHGEHVVDPKTGKKSFKLHIEDSKATAERMADVLKQSISNALDVTASSSAAAPSAAAAGEEEKEERPMSP